MTTAMIMAGGRGERMRQGGGSVPKPLVRIRGVPLLERNLLSLLYAGFADIVVAVPCSVPEISEFARTRCRALAQAAGATLRLVEESRPLGNIGAAAEIDPCGAELVVTFADNLTALDLNALLRHHRQTSAALTAAVHLEPVRLPFGEVELRDDRIVGYAEKPEHRCLISSGLTVLGPLARERLPRGEWNEISRLVNRLLAEGLEVAAYRHDAPWIDVNDLLAVERAERLLATHSEAFECRQGPPDHTVVSVLIEDDGRTLLELRPPDSGRNPDTWDLPGTALEPGRTPASVLDGALRPLAGERSGAWPEPWIFDDLDAVSGLVYRYLVFPIPGGRAPPRRDGGPALRAMSVEDQADGRPVSRIVSRAVAAAAVDRRAWAPA